MDDYEKRVTANPSSGLNARPSTLSRRRPGATGSTVVSAVLVISAIIAVILIVAYLTHRHSGQQQASPRGRGGGNAPVTIGTVTAQKGDMGVYLEALGTVTPVYTVSVVARVPGQVVNVEYKEGQDVHVGDPLVEIDPRPYQAAVLQAKGQLEHDKALLSNAQLDLDRYREAYESNAIPKQQYDTQVASVQQDEGSVDVDEGNLSNAMVNLGYSHITSPIDGRVGLRLVDPGNIVQANGTSPLVVITQTRPITVIFNVAEDDLPKVLSAMREISELPLDIYDREDQTKIASGKLVTLDNQINTATGTLRLRGVCSNEDESLFPNQFVNVHLLVKTLNDVTLLPNSAIQRNSESAYVYQVKQPESGQTNVTVHIQTITTGVTDATNSQVDGVSPGDVVAADNFNRLSDGSTVKLRPSSSAGQEHGENAPEQGQGQGKQKGHHHKPDSQ
ncbi:MAG TPA: efflux RND transporter periplasmic adaptor subunit [Verrucomicrobiae bacterium]|jgi:multidrug efflux system membrane fusion protein|nr:efflux RND transporter periplasmic adaptor subunit [Verrucomicrobiae bacterium]